MQDTRTRRKTITNGRRVIYKKVDMEAVYREIDSGKTVNEVAAEFGVHRSTLLKRHREYQQKLAAEDMEKLPPLPDDI